MTNKVLKCLFGRRGAHSQAEEENGHRVQLHVQHGFGGEDITQVEIPARGTVRDLLRFLLPLARLSEETAADSHRASKHGATLRLVHGSATLEEDVSFYDAGILDGSRLTAVFVKAGPSSIDECAVGRVLGVGSLGDIKVATWSPVGTHYALKSQVKSIASRTGCAAQVMSEVKHLRCLRHPFIVSIASCFQDATRFHIALEYLPGGELLTRLRAAGQFAALVARFYAAQVILALEHCHDNNLVYRNLRPEKVMLGADGYAKLVGFTRSAYVGPNEKLMSTVVGYPEYQAPEVLQNKGHSTPADWWSLGILLFEMVTGWPPFTDDDPMGISKQIVAGSITFPHYIDYNLRKLLDGLLTVSCDKRLGSGRHGAKAIKGMRFFKGMDWNALMEKRLAAPWQLPAVEDDSLPDTTQFKSYPESEFVAEPVLASDDPFAAFQ